MYAIAVPSSKLIVLNPVIIADIVFGKHGGVANAQVVLWCGSPNCGVDVRCRLFAANTPPDAR